MTADRHVLPVLLAGLALTAAARAADDDAERVYRRASPAVLTVLAVDEGGRPAGQGSGVVVAAGRVATNCHVVRDAHGLKVKRAAAEHVARWTLADPSRDLCLLEVAGLDAPPASIRPLDGLAVGEPVFAIGNPLGFGLAVSAGLVSALVEVGGERSIVSTAPQSPGSSGGGLFDAEGRLVGITSGVFGVGQNLNLALPAQWLDELGARGVPPPRVVVPQPEPAWLEEADALRRAGDWERLEAHARAWRQAQPESAYAALTLAMALSGRQRPGEAETAVREALRLDPQSHLGWYQLTTVLHALGRRQEAEAALARAEALLPTRAAVFVMRAEWLREEGRLEEALEQVRKALLFEPGERNYWRLLGLIEQARGQEEAAARAFRAALRLDPSDAQAERALAALLAREGRADEAHRILARGKGAAEAQTLLELGVTEFRRERFAAAESAFRKATELAPESAEAWTRLGSLLLGMGRDAEAGQALERALAVQPGYAMALLERSQWHVKRGDRAAALRDAREATAAEPDNANAWRVLGIRNVEARDFREAVRAFARLDALGQAGVHDLASFAEAQSRIGETAAAHALLARAEQRDPRHVPTLLAAALVHGNGGDVDKALGYLERALAVEPGNAVAWSSKGYALMRKGALAEAVAALETSVRIDPDAANAWINLGQAQMHSRRLGQAILALEKAVRLMPTALDARLYLAQSYVATRQAAKAREHAAYLLGAQPEFAPALSLLVLAELMDGKGEAALQAYQRLRLRDAPAAQRVRAQAIAGGLGLAHTLPQ